MKEIRQIYDWNVSPEDLAMIEKMDAMAADDEEEEMKMMKWAGAGGRRRTISITI